MAPTLPPGLEDVNTASNHADAEVNVMGRVSDHLVPSATRGRDWMSTFTIADASLGIHFGEGLRVKIFRPSELEHPQIRGTGDVVLLRKLRIKEYRGVMMGLSARTTSWIVFPAAEIPEKAPPNRLMIKNLKLPSTAEPSHSEMLYAIELCNLKDRKLDTSSGIPISSTSTLSTFTAPSTASSEAPVSSSKTGGRLSYGGRDKFSLIKDLQTSSFYDIVGQVVKTYPNTGRLEMYVTDYTSNNMLFRYEWDQEDKENSNDNDAVWGNYLSNSKYKKWPGPYGQMTLMVALWPPHSNFAQSNVNEWDFVLLKNVHIKQDRDLKMEGALHEDRQWPSKIQISVLKDHSDERVKNVLRRKREYGEKFKAQSEAFIKQARRQKEDGGQSEKSTSKQAARRKRKAEKLAAAQKTAEAPAKKQKKNQKPRQDEEAAPSPPPAAQPPQPIPKAVPKSNRTDLNKNVHCSHHTIPTIPLSSILSLSDEPSHETTTPNGVTHTLPFQNIKYRTTARVVDFFPPNIANFSVRSRKASEFEALSDYEGSDSDNSSNDQAPSENERSDSDNSSDDENQIRMPPDSDDESAKRPKKMRRRKEASERETRGEDAEEEEQKWEWRFALVLEDADSPAPAKGEERAKMTVYVAQQDGDFLLKEDAVEYAYSSPLSLLPLPLPLSITIKPFNMSTTSRSQVIARAPNIHTTRTELTK